MNWKGLVLFAIMCCLIVFGSFLTFNCIGNQFGVVVKKEVGQANTGVVTQPKQVSAGGDSAVLKEGDKAMYSQWYPYILLGIMVALIIGLTELVGRYGPFSIIPKKTLSLVIAAVLSFVGLAIFTKHDLLYRALTGLEAWFIAMVIYQQLVKKVFWVGWLKKI
jgi:hypothetical protein